MRIEWTLNEKPCSQEVEPGALLSEVLQTELAVWLDGRVVNAGLMLAAQAHGRKLELKPVAQAAPLQENSLVPEPTRC